MSCRAGYGISSDRSTDQNSLRRLVRCPAASRYSGSWRSRTHSALVVAQIGVRRRSIISERREVPDVSAQIDEDLVLSLSLEDAVAALLTKNFLKIMT